MVAHDFNRNFLEAHRKYAPPEADYWASFDSFLSFFCYLKDQKDINDIKGLAVYYALIIAESNNIILRSEYAS